MPWKRTLSWSLSVQVPKRSVLVAAATALAEALVALDEVALPAALPVAAEVLVLTLVAGVAAGEGVERDERIARRGHVCRTVGEGGRRAIAI